MKKYSLLLLLLLCLTLKVFCHTGGYIDGGIKTGIGLGSVIAVVTSWDRNKSVLWAILHSIFSWFYVGYYVITRG